MKRLLSDAQNFSYKRNLSGGQIIYKLKFFEKILW